MSIELFGYSDDPSPIAIGELASGCRRRGYECRVIRGDAQPIVDGTLDSDDAIVGWRPSFFGNRPALKAATTADWKAIGQLQERERVGACAIEICTEPDQYNNTDELRELEAIHGPAYVTCRQVSRVRWYIRLAAGRDALSVELAEAVLRTLLELRGGMFEDPQSGEFEIVPRTNG